MAMQYFTKNEVGGSVIEECPSRQRVKITEFRDYYINNILIKDFGEDYSYFARTYRNKLRKKR